MLYSTVVVIATVVSTGTTALPGLCRPMQFSRTLFFWLQDSSQEGPAPLSQWDLIKYFYYAECVYKVTAQPGRL